MQVQIRWLIRRDMEDVLAIEYESFDQPWLKNDFLTILRQRNCIGLVAIHEGRVVGYAIYMLDKKKLRILRLVAHHQHQRQGIGRQIVERLIGKLQQQRRDTLEIHAHEREIGVQKFFQACGFLAIGVERGYYDYGSHGDAYIMQFTLPGADRLAPVNRISKHFQPEAE